MSYRHVCCGDSEDGGEIGANIGRLINAENFCLGLYKLILLLPSRSSNGWNFLTVMGDMYKEKCRDLACYVKRTPFTCMQVHDY